MKYRFFTTSLKAWKAMLSAISSAHESVYLEMYIFDNDIKEYDFLSELEKCAKRGIKVKIIFDMWGSSHLDREEINRLKNAGAEVLFYSFWLRRTHRKILIVDEEVAFVGGVNIGNTFILWRDLQVRLSGKIVRPIISSFAKVYEECGGKEKFFLLHNTRTFSYKTKLWFIEHGIGKKKRMLQSYYEERIRGAKTSIILVSPYFVPPRWLLAALHQALLRGVAVTIIVPKYTDSVFVDRVNMYYLRALSRVGALCYLEHNMNHAKVTLIDGREGLVGSHNIDMLSFDWNVEAGVFFENVQMVKDISRIVSGWQRDSVLFDAHSVRVYWYDVVIGFLLKLFGFSSPLS